jgi:DNA helicase-2/ATP-dependent DNA helicase PcrA
MFAKDFPSCKTVTIDTTYRCPANISSKAYKLIKHNKHRLDTTPKSVQPDGHIKRLVLDNDFEEASWISNKCKNLINSGIKECDIAILCRTHRVSDNIVRVLQNDGIEINMCGRTKDLMSQSAARDFNSYVHLITNPYDKLSFRRVLKAPDKKMEWRKIAAIESLSRSAEINLLEASKRHLEGKEEIDWLRSIFRLKDLTFEEASSIIKDTLNEFYESRKLLTRSRDLSSVFEVIQTMIRRDKNITAEEYLEDISELSSQHDALEPEHNGINVMTVHTSKGLEWPFVFVPSMEMGSFPIGSNPDPDSLEEERRLFYVAITRAQKGIFITSARVRNVWGKERESCESLFVNEAGLEII